MGMLLYIGKYKRKLFSQMCFCCNPYQEYYRVKLLCFSRPIAFPRVQSIVMYVCEIRSPSMISINITNANGSWVAFIGLVGVSASGIG